MTVENSLELVRFTTAAPIGDTDVLTLPVRWIGPAVAFYQCVLHFTVVEISETTARLQRDDAVIGLSVSGSDPDQASVYFGVTDIDAVHAELTATGIAPTAIRSDEYGGNRYRVCFAKEPYGVCFCFGQQIGV